MQGNRSQVKIGYTDSTDDDEVKAIVRTLQEGNPVKLELSSLYTGNEEIFKELCDELFMERVRSLHTWFNCDIRTVRIALMDLNQKSVAEWYADGSRIESVVS